MKYPSSDIEDARQQPNCHGQLGKQILICIFLVTATCVVYWQILDHEFLNYDDNQYVTENKQVKTDFTRESILWAFTSSYASNWHPLTWLSHMLDYQLYGLNPRGHHLTNLLLHTANALLLFLILVRVTGAVWQSGFAAAMFALHPLNVESVAWVAERKNVLSTIFLFLTLWAYIRYIEKSSIKRYSLIILFFALGLMSKPMLVTLPFVLILLDYWPLGRWKQNPSTQKPAGKELNFWQLLWEKSPLFLIAIGSCLITFVAQKRGGAVESLHYNPLSSRIANALVSYLEYLQKIFWPKELSVFYPHPVDALALWKGALCAITLAGITAWIVRKVRRAPYLAVGWFWYLGTLVPVIGLIQVGEQAMADRYTYIPLIGIFIAVAWGVPELLANWCHRNKVLTIATALVIPVLMTLTWQQTSYWKNSITLFKHAIAVTDTKYPGFVVVHNNLGIALSRKKQFAEAIANFREAIRLQPNYAEAHNNLASTLGDQRKFIEALAHFQEALRLKPNYAEAHNNLGNTLSASMNFEKAVAHYQEAIRIQPDYSEAHFNLGNTLSKQKEFEKAIAHYKEAIKLQPKFTRAHNNLGSTLFQQGKFTDSISHFETAIALDPGYVEAHNNLGSALGQQGQFEAARAHFHMALKRDPGYSNAHKNLAAVLSILAKSKKPSDILK